MRIAIISTAYPLRGGIAQYTALLYRKLIERQHETTILTFKRQYPDFLFPGKTQLDETRDDAFKVPTEPIIDSIGPASWIRAFRRLRTLSPDLLIFKFWMPFFAPAFGVIAWLTKKSLQARIIYLCDNIIPHERRPGDILLTRFALSKGDSFIVQSKTVEEQLLSLFPKARYRVVPHPIYEIFGRPIRKEDARSRLAIDEDRVLLFFGYVRPYKGLDLLLQALPEICERMKVRLLVVGEFYENEQVYRDLARQLHVLDRVTFYAEFVADDDVPVYFSAADVVVLPYKSATQSGIVQLAYHLEKPCIVTDVGGLSEVVLHGQTGFVVEPESPKAISEAVIRYYTDELEPGFSRNVKLEQHRYSWENMIDAIEELAS